MSHARPVFDSADLPAAVEAVARARAVWDRLKADAQLAGRIDDLRNAVAAAEAEAGTVGRPEPFGFQLRLWVLTAAAAGLRATGLKPWDWWVAAVGLGLVGAAAAVPVAVLAPVSTAVRVAVLVGGYLAAAGAAAVELARVRAVGPAAGRDQLLADRAARRRRAAELGPERDRLTADLRRAEAAEAAATALRAAEARLRELEAAVGERRCELHRVNWKALRGVPFEEFLADVFCALGYRAEGTKTAGDQGVDLLVSGGRRRVAVQIKGYVSNVGNDAVQQAHAGKTFYGCTESAVITNSLFTPAAHQLAERVGCRLIDETSIPGLIDGKVYPSLAADG